MRNLAGGAGILLVGESAAGTDGLQHMLTENGVRATLIPAADVEAALALLQGTDAHGRHRRPLPAAVLLDLPEPAAKDFVARSRAHVRTRDLPLVLLLRDPDATDVGALCRRGLNSCVRRPESPADLYDVLSKLVLYWATVNERLPGAWRA